MGLLPGHESVLSLLRAGTVRVRAAAGSSEEFAVTSGFVSFDDDTVTVVVDSQD